MGSESRTIELTVASATDLKKVQKIGSARQKCYVVAYIYAAQRQATHADEAGGVNPTWNAPLVLTCYETDLHPDGSNGSGSSSLSSSSSASSSSPFRAITIDIYAYSSGIFSSGGKLVGTVVVPLQYIASAVQVENLAMMAFDVRRPKSGKVQGKLNLTVKLGPKQAIIGMPAPHQQQMPSYAYHSSKVENTPMMPPLVTSYNMASGTPAALGVYDPNLNSYGKQEVVTGYPAPGHGFTPLGLLPATATNLQPLGERPYAIEGQEMTRKEKRRARRAQKAADPERRAARRKRMKMGAMIAGGILLGLILL